MDIRADAIAHAFPKSHHDPAEDRQAQGQQIPLSPLRHHPAEHVEQDQRGVEDEQQEVGDGKHQPYSSPNLMRPGL